MLNEDLHFTVGETFSKIVKIRSDSRFIRWRGTWSEWRVYDIGDGVKHLDEAYVAVGTSQQTVPGSPGSLLGWSVMRPQDLTGTKMDFVIDGVHSYEPSTIPTLGQIVLRVPPTDFLNPPTSARYRLKMTPPTGGPSFALGGTALFTKP